jgi:xanthine dehydrogenase YagR molybdenum-binding subunit
MAQSKDTKDVYLSGEVGSAAARPGADLSPWTKTAVVGGRKPRVDAYERVSGAAVYPSDMVLPGMLYGAQLWCPHAHARVVSMDASEAERMQGVHAILTIDSPEAKKTRWPYSKDYETALLDPHCLYEGEPIAAVAAESPDIARDALRAIKVEWEVLPHLADERDALAKGAHQVHESGNTVSESSYERGDVASGFEQADVVIEREYRASCEMHTPIELHGCVAAWDGPRLTVWESTQGVYAVQDKVAKVLDMPRSRVRVIGHYVGGGFGSKLEPSKYSILASLLAKKAGRPVKLFLTREETYLTMGNRPPANMALKAGITKDGVLTAMEYHATATGGAFPSGGTSLLDWLAKDLYLCPNVKTTLTDVFINAGPARPFRAPGYPQCSWAVEQMMDELARAIDKDPVAVRIKNIPSVSQAREGQPEYTTNGLEECLKQGADAFGWRSARGKTAAQDPDARVRRGVGVAACNWFVGNGWPPSTVIVKLFSDGSVNLNMGASDIGTGTKTVMAMVVGEVLGVDPDSVQIEHADTGTTQYASASGGSKTVPTEAPAVREAAVNVKRQLLKMAAEQLGANADELVLAGPVIHKKGDESASVEITSLEGLASQRVVMGVGHKDAGPENKQVTPFAAQFCEVEVDTLTGEVAILRLVGVNESGRVMDRLTYDGQIVGGVTMGIGFGMTEARVLDRQGSGKLLNRNWHDYKLPTALDVPAELIPVAVELPDPEANNTGAKGLGEPVTIATGGAIANAVFDACGVRLTQTPINPVTLVSKLAAERGKEA